MKVTKVGNKLTLVIDLVDVESAPESKSGKSKVLFTTGGFKYSDGIGISVNIIAGRK